MIAILCEQGTEDWFQARLGLPTASEFHRIITPTGKPSTQVTKYCYELLAEQMTGKHQEGYKNGWMDRGHDLEDEARRFYEAQRDVTVAGVGFCLTDDRKAGASPDGLVGSAGLLEIKCCAPHTHVQYLLNREVDHEYWPQIQGQLWVTDRTWVDILSYHPEMTPVIVRAYRDSTFIKALQLELHAFSGALESLGNKLRAKGCRFAEREVLA